MTQEKSNLERVVLVGIITKRQNEDQSREYLDELDFLIATAGGISIHRFVQKLESPHSKTFIGNGKLEEVKLYSERENIETVVFDDELSPTQLRNIEKILNLKILDRTNLILDIFARRAKTSYAKTQVSLAQCEYLLPRLTRLWTHLDKQKGGIGMRGPGETEIETDRRILRYQISLLKEKLKSIDKQMSIQRNNRGKMVRVALVGYTNVGKSSLMNLISKSTVFAEDKLFATLDTTVRKVVVENIAFLMTDTVGFIRKLPTQLIASFKSTLDEIREADLLIHVVDISHASFEAHIKAVNLILKELSSDEKPIFMAFNKIDRYRHHSENKTYDCDQKVKADVLLDELKKSWMSKMNTHCVFISVTEKINIEGFKKSLLEMVRDIHIHRFPYNDYLYLQ